MKVNITKSFEVDADPKHGWEILSDLAAVATCMPGVSMGEKQSDTKYKGTIKIRLGPSVSIFNGLVEILSKDDAKKSVSITSKGEDTKGTSSAQMDLSATIKSNPDGKSFVLTGSATITVIGKIASFGQRMMQQVGDQVLAEFSKTYTKRAQALGSSTQTAVVGKDKKVYESSKEIGGFWFTIKIVFGYIKSFFKR